jgi:hypothetical protein
LTIAIIGCAGEDAPDDFDEAYIEQDIAIPGRWALPRRLLPGQSMYGPRADGVSGSRRHLPRSRLPERAALMILAFIVSPTTMSTGTAASAPIALRA